jgi:hypothetical protein
MPDTPDTTTDRRTELLRIAEQDLSDIRDRLTALRADRDRLRADLRKATDEANVLIASTADRIRDLVQAEADADSLVRSLTPKAPRKRNGLIAPQHDPAVAEALTVDAEIIEDDEG